MKESIGYPNSDEAKSVTGSERGIGSGSRTPELLKDAMQSIFTHTMNPAISPTSSVPNVLAEPKSHRDSACFSS